MYRTGNGVTKDVAKALLWITKAAKNNNPNSENQLGFMYANGIGVNKNQKKAVYWYKKSALHGYVLGQYNLS